MQKKEKKKEEKPFQKAAENTEEEGAGRMEVPDFESILARRKGMRSDLPEDVRLEMEKKRKHGLRMCGSIAIWRLKNFVNRFITRYLNTAKMFTSIRGRICQVQIPEKDCSPMN
jgi:hypothetical protein